MTFTDWWADNRLRYNTIGGAAEAAWDAALKTSERRKTVRAKRPVQHRKADMPLCRKADICPDVIQRYCGGGGSGAVSQLGCYRRAARSAVA
jgi:hypothetical protein